MGPLSNLTVNMFYLTFGAMSALTGGSFLSEIGLNHPNRLLVFIKKISKETGRFLGRLRNVVANSDVNLKYGCFL